MQDSPIFDPAEAPAAALNPYAAPGASVPGQEPQPGAPENAEAIRRAHLSVEASLKALGIVLVMIAVAILLALLNDLGSGSDFRPGSKNGPEVALIIAVVFMGLPAALGVLFLRLSPVARIVATLIALPSLLAYPAGTLIGALLLFRLFSKKGGVVFGKDYRAIVAATPQVRPHARILVWLMVEMVFLPLLVVAVTGW